MITISDIITIFVADTAFVCSANSAGCMHVLRAPPPPPTVTSLPRTCGHHLENTAPGVAIWAEQWIFSCALWVCVHSSSRSIIWCCIAPPTPGLDTDFKQDPHPLLHQFSNLPRRQSSWKLCTLQNTYFCYRTRNNLTNRYHGCCSFMQNKITIFCSHFSEKKKLSTSAWQELEFFL